MTEVKLIGPRGHQAIIKALVIESGHMVRGIWGISEMTFIFTGHHDAEGRRVFKFSSMMPYDLDRLEFQKRDASQASLNERNLIVGNEFRVANDQCLEIGRAVPFWVRFGGWLKRFTGNNADS